jgi:prepilin-type N-terminal cleavage/methylation domain-containing protein
MNQQFTKLSKVSRQAGMTLIEIIVVLAIGALIIGGALSLYSNASSAQASNQMNSDLTAIRASVKSMYATQGGYGAASLNSVLITANKVPTTMAVSGSTISHALNGTLTITGATSNFTMAATNIPTAVCVALLSAASGYTSIQVGSNAARTTFPITPANAATDCAAAATQTITFTAN